MVTYVYLPLPLPFIFTAAGNVETTPAHPIAAYTAVLRPEVRSLTVDGERVQALRKENRTELVDGNRTLGVRRESRLIEAA